MDPRQKQWGDTNSIYYSMMLNAVFKPRSSSETWSLVLLKTRVLGVVSTKRFHNTHRVWKRYTPRVACQVTWWVQLVTLCPVCTFMTWLFCFFGYLPLWAFVVWSLVLGAQGKNTHRRSAPCLQIFRDLMPSIHSSRFDWWSHKKKKHQTCTHRFARKTFVQSSHDSGRDSSNLWL